MKFEKPLLFACGALFGAGLCYLYLNRKVEALVQEAIDIEKDKVVVPERVLKTPGTPNAVRAREGQKKQMKRLVKQYDGSGNVITHEADDYPREEDDEDAPDAWRQYKDVIYSISDVEFEQSIPGYETITIMYYEVDGVLADSDESVFDNPSLIIGLDNLDKFGEDSNDPDVMYIRNENFGIDYEVIRIHKSYAETVGMFPPDDEDGDQDDAK